MFNSCGRAYYQSLAWDDASCDAGARFLERLRLKVRGQRGAKKPSKIIVREARREAKTLSRVLKLRAILREHFTIAILATPRSERQNILQAHDDLPTLMSILYTPDDPERFRRSEGPRMRSNVHL